MSTSAEVLQEEGRAPPRAPSPQGWAQQEGGSVRRSFSRHHDHEIKFFGNQLRSVHLGEQSGLPVLARPSLDSSCTQQELLLRSKGGCKTACNVIMSGVEFKADLLRDDH